VAEWCEPRDCIKSADQTKKLRKLILRVRDQCFGLKTLCFHDNDRLLGCLTAVV
jgi:hypothetical protein